MNPGENGYFRNRSTASAKAAGWSSMMKWNDPSIRSSRARQGRVGVGIGLVDRGLGRTHDRVVGIEQRGRGGDRGQLPAHVGGQDVVHRARHDRLRRGPGPVQRRLQPLGRLDQARQGQGLLAGEHLGRHGGHCVAHRGGLRLDRLDRGGGREQHRVERQAVDDHQTADVFRMAAGQHQAGQAAHRVADHHRRLQPGRLDVAVDGLDQRLQHRSLGVAADRRAGEARDLHHMDAVAARQLLDGGIPDGAGRGQAGDQDHVGPLPRHGDGDAVGGRRVGVLAAEHADGGENGQQDDGGVETRSRSDHRLGP
jgi:hypothetical protein